MKLCDYQGYEIHVPTSGGKAGTGHNKTSTIQIRAGNFIKRQIRFSMDKPLAMPAAVAKAKKWIAEQQRQQPA